MTKLVEVAKMRREMIGLVVIAFLGLTSGTFAQDQPLKVKGGHVLGESAEQFFSEGYEQGAFNACKTGDFKTLAFSSKRKLKGYCSDLADSRDDAVSGKRSEYKGGGDTDERRTDTFTFDQGHLVKMELEYPAPNPEFNYRGEPFDKILGEMKKSYGPPTSETAEPTQNTYGVPMVAHHELWLAPESAIVITEKPGADGSTTLAAFTRAEYDRMVADAAKGANPLQ